MIRGIRVRTPATTANLGAGFDSLGLALGLYNDLTLEPIEAGTEVVIAGEGNDSLPRDATHTVVRAVERLFRLLGRPMPPLRIRQENGIPLTRGLGSSSAAIVGGLAGANALAGSPFSDQQLVNLAAAMDGHPDNVTPCLVGGLAVAAMEGTHVHYAPVPVPEGLHAALLIPDFEMPTPTARDQIPESLGLRDAVFTLSRAALTTAAIATGRWDLLNVGMQDHLHQPYRTDLFPQLPLLLCAALDAGARGAALSGSGPTVIALTDGPPEPIAGALAQAAATLRLRGRALCLPIDQEGTRVWIDE